MGNDSRVIGKIKTQITRFSKKVSAGFPKPTRRFVREMIYGIQAGKDVKLSNVARSLNEEIPLIQTEKRLSWQGDRRDLTEGLNRNLIKEGSRRVGSGTVLAVDLGDINKPYAEKMENLATVRDGSEGKIDTGYWLINVVGADVEGEDLVPLYSELYSQEARGFRSENIQIFKAVDMVREGVEERGIWAMDRGGDRKVILEGFLGRRVRFVIRQTGERDFVFGNGKRRSCLSIALGCTCRHKRRLVVDRDGLKEEKVLFLGYEPVKLPFSDEQLYLVVIKGYGGRPLMLLTNLKVINLDVSIERILHIYLTRWKCDESYRFIKQNYNLEDLRVRGYNSIRNTVALVQAVFYFVSVELGRNLKLSILLKKVFEKSKRFFEVPKFKQYAIADGIYRLLFSSKTGITLTTQMNESPQLSLSFCLDVP
jgi:hypothetical protein